MPCVSIALALLTACATPVLCQSGLHLVPPDGDVRSRSSDEACRVMPALRIAAPALSGLDGWTGDADNGADALGDEHPVVTDGSLCPSSCVRPPGADLPPVTLRHGPLWRSMTGRGASGMADGARIHTSSLSPPIHRTRGWFLSTHSRVACSSVRRNNVMLCYVKPAQTKAISCPWGAQPGHGPSAAGERRYV